ncbi:uncharacterized protein YaaR (DUF327 family) [Symbiobacterium terraclitae]|uniref:Uncharacterized protein YaaR (DUF327 family) n=1 Tax=Symbiobacterium terraclitae TaxID=557451 RepID=A0ABS4JW10_9FIRM|nr:YaaR family protein [Symbiobacterium terraclitae]MBP2019706.1 uncharacterized protein YaaR (DUF327 family) [Symbiobacterium terraclitae]
MDRVRLMTGLTRVATTGHGERASASARVPFREQLARSHAMHFNERIDQALQEIDELGRRLTESLSQNDLRLYRDAIGRLFRDLTRHMLEVRQDLEWDSQAWEQRTMVTIRRVDQRLEELSRLVLEQEQDRLAILAAVDEIKGLLLDVRM